MNKIANELISCELIRENYDALGFRPAASFELLPFGIATNHSEGWQLGAVETPRGVEVVAWKGGVAWVAVYGLDGNFVDRTRYYLSRYFTMVEDLILGKMSLEEIREADTGDDTPTAVTTGLQDKTEVAGLDQFYYSGGFFRLECSTPLPSGAMAEALLAAWKSIEDVANAAHGCGPNRSHA